MKNFSPVTLGKSVTKVKKNGLVLTETSHKPNLSLSRHCHKHASIICILEGSYTERIDNHSFEMTPQSLLVKPGGEYHSNKYHRAGAHCLIVEITPERLTDHHSLPEVFDRAKHFQRRADYFSIINRIRREIKISDSASELAIEGLTLELLANLDRQARKFNESREPYWLKEARDYIHANFKEPISLSTVAETVDFHPSHVARVFRQKHNCSIGTYIRRLRLENAAEQLVNTKKPLAEISHSAGFYDQSHFTSAFRSHTGITPRQYRAEKS